MKFLGKLVLLLSVPCTSVMFRRPFVPGGVVEMRPGQPSQEDSANGWLRDRSEPDEFDVAVAAVAALPPSPRPMAAGVGHCGPSGVGSAIVPYQPQMAVRDPDVPPPPVRRGRRQARPWVRVDAPVDRNRGLREEAREWLRKEQLFGKVGTLVLSSFEGTASYLAKCSLCMNCTLAWQFHLRDDCCIVQKVGECSGAKNVKKIKKEHAKAHRGATPGETRIALRNVIPEDEIPEVWRCANMRPARQQQAEAPVHIEAASLGALKTFVHHAHPSSSASSPST